MLATPRGDWQVHDLQLESPRDGEVLVRMAYAGLCYSDEHLRFADVAQLPVVGGHEGAGVVEATGPGVQGLATGDHVVLTFVAVCGRCHWCSTGRANLCEGAGPISSGAMTDGTFRYRSSALTGTPGGGLGGYCALGTFSQYAVVGQNSCVKVDPAIPLQVAALVSCGVLTGWGAAARTAGVRTGDTVVVIGLGGIGINAVQGARHRGAACIIAVDPVAAKRDLARRLGATDVATSLDKAARIAAARNPVAGGADASIVCTGNLSTEVVTGAFAATGKGGVLVIAGMSHDPQELNIQLPGTVLAGTERRVQGSFLGSCNPVRDVPLLLGLYQRGQLVLDELISRRYGLDEITDGYADLAAGRNVRGLIDFGTDQAATGDRITGKGNA